MDLRCAVSLPRGIALRWMVILSSTGFTGCGNSASFHSERSQESLPIENKSPRGILRANSALRMTVFRFFPQPVKPVLLKIACRAQIRKQILFRKLLLRAVGQALDRDHAGGEFIFAQDHSVA